MPFAASIDDRAGELRQRELALDAAAFEGDARHAVNERARLVLAERAGARFAHLQQAHALTNDLEMMGAGRDIDAARLNALIVRRLADGHRAFAVEAAGKSGGKAF